MKVWGFCEQSGMISEPAALLVWELAARLRVGGWLCVEIRRRCLSEAVRNTQHGAGTEGRLEWLILGYAMILARKNSLITAFWLLSDGCCPVTLHLCSEQVLQGEKVWAFPRLLSRRGCRHRLLLQPPKGKPGGHSSSHKDLGAAYKDSYSVALLCFPRSHWAVQCYSESWVQGLPLRRPPVPADSSMGRVFLGPEALQNITYHGDICSGWNSLSRFNSCWSQLLPLVFSHWLVLANRAAISAAATGKPSANLNVCKEMPSPFYKKLLMAACFSFLASQTS